MPTYCYVTDDGQVDEIVAPIGEAPKTIKINGVEAHRDFRAENVGVPAPGGWPMTCVASGVHPADAGKLRQHLADKGVPTDVTRDGDPVYRDAAHRRRALKARGMFDKTDYR